MAKTTKKADIADVKTEEVKLVEAKTTEKKTTAKSAKAPAVKAVVEYKGVQVSLDDIVAAIKADWKGEAIKTLEVYVKPEDAAAYYVVNGAEGGKVSL